MIHGNSNRVFGKIILPKHSSVNGIYRETYKMMLTSAGPRTPAPFQHLPAFGNRNPLPDIICERSLTLSNLCYWQVFTIQTRFRVSVVQCVMRIVLKQRNQNLSQFQSSKVYPKAQTSLIFGRGGGTMIFYNFLYILYFGFLRGGI